MRTAFKYPIDFDGKVSVVFPKTLKSMNCGKEKEG